MSKQINPIIMAKIKTLLLQPNLTTKPVRTSNKVYQEAGDEVLMGGKTLVLKRLIQHDANNKFSCVIVEIDGEQYVGDYKQFLDIEDLLAPIKLKTTMMGRESSLEK